MERLYRWAATLRKKLFCAASNTRSFTLAQGRHIDPLRRSAFIEESRRVLPEIAVAVAALEREFAAAKDQGADLEVQFLARLEEVGRQMHELRLRREALLFDCDETIASEEEDDDELSMQSF